MPVDQLPEETPDDNGTLESSTVQPNGEEEPPANAAVDHTSHSWKKWLLGGLITVLVVIMVIVGGLFGMASNDAGSKKILDTIAGQQTLIKYHYVGGNFNRGLILKDISVDLKKVRIQVDQAVLVIGWRGLIQKQLHFRKASLHNFQILLKQPPNGKPFEFPRVSIPFVLRFDEAYIHTLAIRGPQRKDIVFPEITLKKASWQDTVIQTEDSSVSHAYFSGRNVTGTLKLEGHYPINAKGQLSIPALTSLKLAPISVAATGDLETLKASGKVEWPDPAAATAIVRPFANGVPFNGTMHWGNFRWPFAQSLKLQSTFGSATVQGNLSGISIGVQSDLKGENVPGGTYQGELYTDYRSLRIQRLDGSLLNGKLSAQGLLDWQQGVHWNLSGQAQQIEALDYAPAAAVPYLPKKLTARLATTGTLGNRVSHVGAWVKQPTGELWVAGIARAGSLANSALPLAVDARWKNLQRSLPGVGKLSSTEGRSQIGLYKEALSIRANAAVASSDTLPAGRYQAQLHKAGTLLQFSQLAYQGSAGALTGSGQLRLATAKTPLNWSAQLATNHFEPARILPSIPLQSVQGTITAHGTSQGLQHTVWVDRTALKGSIQAETGKPARPMQLDGSGQVVVLMNPATPVKSVKSEKSETTKATSSSGSTGIKSYAVRYQGKLATPGVPAGDLRVRVSGTPELTRIEQFEHHGAAGDIRLTGQMMLAKGANSGPSWSVDAQLKEFNPGFFIADYPGKVTGNLHSTGAWQTSRKEIQLSQLNLYGILRNQPLTAQGSLDLVFDPKAGLKSWIPQRFTADSLKLGWAGNTLNANGNKQNMLLTVDARALQRIHPQLSGSINGVVELTGDLKAPDAKVDLTASKLKFGTFSLLKGTVKGILPHMGRLPGQLTLNASGVHQGSMALQEVSAQFQGTQASHTLDIRLQNNQSQLSARLAGSMDAQFNWQGQLQQGALNTRQLKLIQQQAANLAWNQAKKQLQLAAHCWAGANARLEGGRLCITEPLLASSQQGQIAFALSNLDLHGFEDFMPEGMVWVGKLEGTGKVNWLDGHPPSLDAQLYTDNGAIGLLPDDPQDPPLTLPYQRLSLTAKTTPEGIKLRFDAKTTNTGTGYIDATIDPKTSPKTINGALVLDNVQLRVLKPFFPGIRVMEGTASLAGGMSGPLTGPAVYGNFKLDNGRIVLADLPVSLDNIAAKATIRGTEANLVATFNSGDGTGQLAGNANWSGEPQITLAVTGDRLLLRQPPMLVARLNPAVNVQILPTAKKITVNGKVLVPTATLSPAPSDSDAVAKSSDVRVVDLRKSATLGKVMAAARPWRIFADVNVVMGDEVAFKGFGTVAPLGGQLQLRQRGVEGMTAVGDIRVTRPVRLEAFGQTMTLRKGAARFNGNMREPVLDIEAVKEIDHQIIGVRVGGKLSSPGIVLFNDAGLSEQEALNALLAGRISQNNTVTNTAGFRSDVNNTLAAAGLSYGLSGSRAFTNKIGRSFGLSNLTLDAEGTGNDTQVNITGYLTPDLFLRYGVGVFTPVNKLTLRYQVNRRLYLEASSALDKAIDLFYNWRF